VFNLVHRSTFVPQDIVSTHIYSATVNLSTAYMADANDTVSLANYSVVQTTSFQALCEELSHFETGISPWTNPLEWSRLNTEDILKIVGGLLGPQGAVTFHGIVVYQVRQSSLVGTMSPLVNYTFCSASRSTCLHV
jgi:hypothetical protein